MEKISDIITAINTCRADAIGMKKVCEQCPYHSHSNCISDLKEDIIAALKPRGYNFNTREKRMPDCPLIEEENVKCD